MVFDLRIWRIIFSGYMLMCLSIQEFVICVQSKRPKLEAKEVAWAPKDYYVSVKYHSSKENIVVDALSRISMSSLAHVDKAKIELVKDV